MKKALLTIMLCTYISTIFAQIKPQFWDDVQIIKSYDKLYQPPAHPIVFIGSSSIRKWDNLQEVFGRYIVMNRGIGGAVIDDIAFYLNDMVFPYNPRQIVLYVGENDIVNETVTADTILNKTKRLYQLIRAKMPAVPIIYIGMKPSPSREKYMPKAKAANSLIKTFLVANDKNTVFVDVFPLMLTDEGKLRPELYLNDKLHMKAEGYAVWAKAIEPYLLKNNK
ncbi:GDSL-type esterase/lipase family protein [Mucilaginibacter terrae]|uniref:GDSL-type esterase/lipase family protein n=1 Tax=Mucilaginibacter terrae TaxID=1955052 RepID=UPI00363231C2